MAALINKSTIQQYYDELLATSLERISLERWCVEPSGFNFIDSNRVYGMAQSNGVMRINEKFVGTTAHKKLKHTIAHEFAHFCAGLHHGHGKRFQTVEALFQAGLPLVPPEDIEQINVKTKHKYTLRCKTEDGHVFDLWGADKKSRAYTCYDPKTKPKRYKAAGVSKRITSFEYAIN